MLAAAGAIDRGSSMNERGMGLCAVAFLSCSALSSCGNALGRPPGAEPTDGGTEAGGVPAPTAPAPPSGNGLDANTGFAQTLTQPTPVDGDSSDGGDDGGVQQGVMPFPVMGNGLDAGADNGGAEAGLSAAPVPVSSKCGPTPTRLVDLEAAAAQAGVQGLAAPPIAVNANDVYFVVGNWLMSASLRGGPVVALTTLWAGSYFDQPDLELTSTTIIFHELTTAANEEIGSVAVDGGGPVGLATSSGRVVALATDGQSIYFSDQEGVKVVPLSESNPSLIAQQAGVTGIAAVGERLILTSSDPTTGIGSVFSMPSQGGPLTTLATNQENASFPMACGQDICWWTGMTPAGPIGTSGPGSIMRLASSGSVAKIPNAPYFPWNLVFDGNDFFETVACDICSGSLLRIPADGGSAVVMGPGAYVAVDDTCAYWSQGEPSAGIFSVVKSYVSP